MQDYLLKFTEKVIIATKSGETEKEKITKELTSLLDNKPKDASKEMIQYIEFLLAVSKAEDTESLWKSLPKNLQDIFGQVMKKFKGADIFKDLEDLTKKAITASKSGDDEKINIINELEAIFSQRPKDGSKSVIQYLEFLIELAKGNDVQNLIQEQEKKLINIYHTELEKLFKPDMIKFFTQLTEMAFGAKDSENAKASTVMKLKELLTSNPPAEIRNYLNLLLAVTEDDDIESLKNGVPAELMAIFNEIQCEK